MANQEAASTQDQLKLSIRVDKKRAADDPFKLPKFLLADATGDLAALVDTDVATAPAEGDRAGASERKRRAFTELARQLRGGQRFIGNIDEDDITEDERTSVFEAYGWKGGKVGHALDDDSAVLANVRLALSITAEEVPDPKHRYPAARLARIETQLGIIEADQATATGGDRQKATRLRNLALETAATTLARVRFYYCCASRDADQTPELARIGFTPRHDPQPAGGKRDGGMTPPPAPPTGPGTPTPGAPA